MVTPSVFAACLLTDSQLCPVRQDAAGGHRTQARRHPGTTADGLPRKMQPGEAGGFRTVLGAAPSKRDGSQRGVVLCHPASPVLGPEPGQGWTHPQSPLLATRHCWVSAAGGVGGGGGRSAGGPGCGCPAAPVTQTDASLRTSRTSRGTWPQAVWAASGPLCQSCGCESTLGFLEGREGLFAGRHLLISAFHWDTGAPSAVLILSKPGSVACL